MALTSAMNAANLKAALTLAAAGFAVFPVKVFVTPDRPGKLQKRPLIEKWQKMEPLDGAELVRLWNRPPDDVVVPGVSLAHSNLLLIDCDRHPGGPDGIAAFAQVAADHPRYQPMPAVRTANGGGVHLYFRQPIDGAVLGNGRGALPPGIDVRGAGGFAVGPGSVTPWGSWTEIPGKPSLTGGTILILPTWLETIIRAPSVRPERSASNAYHPLSSSGAWWLDGLTRTVATEMPGSRNRALFWAACRAWEHIREGRGSTSEAIAALLDAARACGLVKDDGHESVLATIKSGLKERS